MTPIVSNPTARTKEYWAGLAADLGVPLLENTAPIIEPGLLKLIPEALARTHGVVPLAQTSQTLTLAMCDPTDLQTIDFIQRKTGLTVEPQLVPPNIFENLLRNFHPTLQAEMAAMIVAEDLTINANSETNDPLELERVARDLPIVRIVETIIEHAIREQASDIHIEPDEDGVTVRYRIDGVLKTVMTLAHNTAVGIVARIKILSGLKLDEHRLPQDGRFKIVIPSRTTFRVSVIPILHGEKIELRLLPSQGLSLTLEQLGLAPDALARLQRSIARPHGMILATGPTGSGKTTSLYAMINVLNRPSVNIVTIEDPIEYEIPHINQSQVNPKIGFTFSVGLRSFLRQDPNVIMIGEIRDNETATTAAHAALTGHLVLSTLHTNDAPTAVPRLTEMGVPPFLVASTVRCIVAQRLVRTLCKECKTTYTIDRAMRDVLARALPLIEVEHILAARGIITTTDGSLVGQKAWVGKGCNLCGQEGFRGRTGIYEILEVTPPVREAIMRGATDEQLRTLARRDGMLTILEDGFRKVFEGITTIEEVLRVAIE